MARFARTGFLTGLVALATLCAGCNIMALPFFLIPGMEPMHEPMCKLAPGKKDDHVKVVILASTGLENRSELVRADRELSSLLVRQLQEAFKKNKEDVSVVSATKVEKYKDDHPDWQSESPAAIGKHFHADYVVELDIESLTLYKEGSARTIFQGHAKIAVSVIDVHKPGDDPIFKHPYRCEFPKDRPIFSMDSDAEQFRYEFMRTIAREICWYFAKHPMEDDQKFQTVGSI
jgi:hypothetical protein